YIVYNSLYSSIHRAAEKYGGLLVEKATGLVTIVGGKELGSLVNELTSIGFVGVGVSPIGCNAYRNAFKALQHLIDGVMDGRLYIIQG
ncbi:MAG: GTP cyclohydrolase, partial [Desulfurococcus sp.]